MANLASAAYVSPFDQAAVCAIDGFGDFVSTSWGVLNGTRVDVQGRVLIPVRLREAATMAGDVDVLGQYNYLEVWNHDRLLARLGADLAAHDDRRDGRVDLDAKRLLPIQHGVG